MVDIVFIAIFVSCTTQSNLQADGTKRNNSKRRAKTSLVFARKRSNSN